MPTLELALPTGLRQYPQFQLHGGRMTCNFSGKVSDFSHVVTFTGFFGNY